PWLQAIPQLNKRHLPAVDRIVAGASDAERRKLYRDNAIGFYRL
ncbi:MAG: hypothetical protein QOK29_4168, partial [Rhodospirillaceae bacterium]|nr:hypothetical protein [Rhodospirillaceae bacterium]